MKEKYEPVELEVISFETGDIMKTSYPNEGELDN